MDLLQFVGRFHVLVLHLPIGILLMVAILEVYGSIRSEPRSKTLNTLWFWGFFSAVAACTLGYLLSLGGGYDPEAVTTHRNWGLSVAAFSLLCWLYFRSNRFPIKTLVVSVCAVQLFMLFSTGHYGANMTHGSTYLFEYAPNPLRALADLPPHEPTRPKITVIANADVYLDIIKPILKQRCTSCHNPGKSKGRLDITQYATLLDGGKSGPAVTPKDLTKSELFRRITLGSHEEKYMPADGKTPLTDEQVKALGWWIIAGAPNQGLVRDLGLGAADKKLLSLALGLDGNVWPLEPISAKPINHRIELEQNGFIVKNIAKDLNYLDVDFSTANKPLTDAALASLVAAKDHISWLNLGGSEVSDKQLQTIGQLNNLLKLRLEKNPISSGGIKQLTMLPHLQYLNLYGTKVNELVFDSLEEMEALRSVFLSMTAVSAEKVTQFINATGGHVEITANMPQVDLNQSPTAISPTNSPSI